MKRLLITLAYGVAGIVLALALSLGAFALAGREISDPTEPLATLTPALAPPSPRETPDADRTPGKNDDREGPRPTSSASADDHGGDDDDAGADDGSNSGSGSDDGNSGSGSDDGHEDDDSGSGSDDSDDEHDDD